MVRHLMAVFAVLALVGGAPSADAADAATSVPPRIATAELAKRPDFASPELSPDGKRVAFRTWSSGKEAIAFRDLADGRSRGFTVGDKQELLWFSWAGNDRILFGVAFIGEFRYEERRFTKLMQYDVRTGVATRVGPPEQGFDGDNVIHIDPDGRFAILSIQKNVFEYPSALKISLADNKVESLVNPRPGVWRWYADDAGAVRAGLGYQQGRWKFYYRPNAAQDFRVVDTVKESDDDDLLDVSGMTVGSDIGFALSNAATGRAALYKFDFATRTLGERVYGHDIYDVGDYWLNQGGTAAEGVYYVGDAAEYVFFDPALKDIQSLLTKALPGKQTAIVSQSRDRKTHLILAEGPDDPGVYYVLNSETLAMEPIAEYSAAVSPDHLARTKAVRYKARDGKDIPAYLTLPKGRAAKGLPLIIMPHGGPYGVRDQLTYDADAQFLANRGYAVLQPNYRGSSGYGEAFSDAGRGQIGRKMQDDLDDGMDWLVGEGIVDKGRVCVVGASYGGYAALWAATRNPERYRCSASFAGVTDWSQMLQYDRKFFTRVGNSRWEARVTDEGDLDLDTVSPLRSAASIDRPLLIAHGEDDSTVPISQSKKLVAALKKAGKGNYEFVAYKGEGHGFADAANQKDWYDRLGAFLDKHNPAE
jgi:dipeptidyl aminopeptidase/acylaminoacyl peptidase